jgi:predicted nucleic-acid-binding Zn-ribbon protein
MLNEQQAIEMHRKEKCIICGSEDIIEHEENNKLFFMQKDDSPEFTYLVVMCNSCKAEGKFILR